MVYDVSMLRCCVCILLILECIVFLICIYEYSGIFHLLFVCTGSVILFSHDVLLQLFHGMGMMSIDTTLQIIPQILDGAETTAVWRGFDLLQPNVHS